MPYVELTGGWSNYTGFFGTVEFKDGKSVEEISSVEAERLGAIVDIRTADGHNPSPAQVLIDTRANSAQVSPGLRKMTQEESDAHRQASAPQSKPAADQTVAQKYTQEQLESLADKQGITGLRAVGEEFGVKASSIGQLIERILEAQEGAK